MFALAAVITFALALLLALFGVNTGNLDLTVLGLLFVALHLLVGGGWPWARRP
jgi:hypothetical protein